MGIVDECKKESGLEIKNEMDWEKKKEKWAWKWELVGWKLNRKEWAHYWSIDPKIELEI